MSEPECSYIGRCNSCLKHGLSDVQRAAARAIAEILKLPRDKQGAAFVLACKIVIEGGAVDLSITPSSPIDGEKP